METNIKNLSELETFAKKLAASMQAGDVFGISGDLGAGKTTLTQMIGRELGIKEPMTSPTFVFRKEYPISGRGEFKKLVHMDAYRIEGGNAEDLGELQELDAVTLIEWPERIENRLPPDTQMITISIQQDESRVITMK